MTREEAIAVLEDSKRQSEIMRDNPSTFWASHQMADGVKTTERRIEALDLALSVLRPVSRERVEKVWRGEWKRRNTKNGVEWFCSKCGYVSSPKIQYRDFIPFPENRPMLFCNACGTPMTDEAVQMVMERMEALYEST